MLCNITNKTVTRLERCSCSRKYIAVASKEFILKCVTGTISIRLRQLDTLAKKEGEVSNYLGGRKKETKLSTEQCTRGGILFISNKSFSPAPVLWDVTVTGFLHFLLSPQTSPLLFPRDFCSENGNDKSSRMDGRTEGSL